MDGGGRPFIDAWPKELVAKKQDAEMRLHLKNGSVIQVMGADDPDKAVGANPVGMVYSEYALCSPIIWKLTSPILNENGGWAIFNSTPRGENHFYDLMQAAVANKTWFSSHQNVVDTKVLSPDQLKIARDELKDEALFQQEYMTSFKVPLQGAYYDGPLKWLMKNKRLSDSVQVEPRLEVHTAWDLGMDDATSIWFFQIYMNEIRVVDYYENSGESLLHYIKYLRQWGSEHDTVFGKHYAPHDIKVRELTSGKSRWETAREMGIRFNIVQKHSISDGIDQVRNTLPRCWFNSKTCSMGINALKSYRKEWDDSRQVFKTRPLHDWASHAADSFRYLAWGIMAQRLDKRRAPTSIDTTCNLFDIYD
jgi:hypothetical protein